MRARRWDSQEASLPPPLMTMHRHPVLCGRPQHLRCPIGTLEVPRRCHRRPLSRRSPPHGLLQHRLPCLLLPLQLQIVVQRADMSTDRRTSKCRTPSQIITPRRGLLQYLRSRLRQRAPAGGRAFRAKTLSRDRLVRMAVAALRS